MYRRYRYRRAGRSSVRNVSSFLSSSLHFPGFRYSPDALSCLSNMHLYTISPPEAGLSGTETISPLSRAIAMDRRRVSPTSVSRFHDTTSRLIISRLGQHNTVSRTPNKYASSSDSRDFGICSQRRHRASLLCWASGASSADMTPFLQKS